ncbi:MAG TPA: peptidylprolyl isomerase [Gemmatimonadaceae bacterium]|nr:peptidylprolyl isomerase [Gemmatimonadaceae bacterium]
MTHRNIPTLVAVVFIALAGCSQPRGSALLSPNADSLAQPAPDSFKVAVETSKGRFVILAHRSWAPNGVDRFYYLATNRFYDGTKFFRNLSNFMAQVGIHGDPSVNDVWAKMLIPDDPVKQSNERGTVSFATGGPNTRSTQIFINKRDNSRLDAMGFAPIGLVTDGMHVIDALYTAYGEGPPTGGGPDQSRIEREGNRYLNNRYPRLDSIISTRVLKE